MRFKLLLWPVLFLVLSASGVEKTTDTGLASHGLEMRLEIMNPTAVSPLTTVRVIIKNIGQDTIILKDAESVKGDYHSALRDRFVFEVIPEKRTLAGQTEEGPHSQSPPTEELGPGNSLNVEWEIKDPMIHSISDYYWDVLRFPTTGKFNIRVSARLDTNVGSIELVSNSAEMIIGKSHEAPKAMVAKIIEIIAPSKIKLNVGRNAKIERGDRFWLPPTMTRGLWTFKVSQVTENECLCDVIDSSDIPKLGKIDLSLKDEPVILAPLK